MPTLQQKIIEILNANTSFYDRVRTDYLADQILKEVKENPQIKKGQELLKQKRADDKWERDAKKAVEKR